jgi:hypothetical protein
LETLPPRRVTLQKMPEMPINPGGCDVVTEKRPGSDGGELLEAANPLNGVVDERTRPPRLKLFAPAIEVVRGREFDPRPRLTRTIL